MDVRKYKALPFQYKLARFSLRLLEAYPFLGEVCMRVEKYISDTHGFAATDGYRLYLNEKMMNGTSCTVYYKDGKIGVCGRNKEYKEDVSTCSMWAWVYKNDLVSKLIKLNENIAIQGEFCGEGIQKNRLKLMKPNLFVFNVFTLLDGSGVKKAGLSELKRYCEQLGLDTVPIEEVGESFNYTLDELLEKARGKYASGLDKEGIVVRTQNPVHNYEINHKMSFKVINNDFLKKEKD